MKEKSWIYESDYFDKMRDDNYHLVPKLSSDVWHFEITANKNEDHENDGEEFFDITKNTLLPHLIKPNND